jgi:hypothetical protein
MPVGFHSQQSPGTAARRAPGTACPFAPSRATATDTPVRQTRARLDGVDADRAGWPARGRSTLIWLTQPRRQSGKPRILFEPGMECSPGDDISPRG